MLDPMSHIKAEYANRGFSVFVKSHALVVYLFRFHGDNTDGAANRSVGIEATRYEAGGKYNTNIDVLVLTDPTATQVVASASDIEVFLAEAYRYALQEGIDCYVADGVWEHLRERRDTCGRERQKRLETAQRIRTTYRYWVVDESTSLDYKGTFTAEAHLRPAAIEEPMRQDFEQNSGYDVTYIEDADSCGWQEIDNLTGEDKISVPAVSLA